MMSMNSLPLSEAPETYFGVSLLDLDTYGAHLMANRITKTQANELNLFFDHATAYYHRDKNALTVEGFAKSPEFAVHALESYAKVAREMDELAKPFAS